MEVTQFDIQQLRKHILAVAQWNSRFFEIPDVIDFQDYVKSAARFAEDLSLEASQNRPPRELTFFPYPNYRANAPKKVRTMAVASPADLTLLRLSAGRIAEVTDKLISDHVCSYRIAPRYDPDAAWTFRPRGWMRFINDGVTILDQGETPFMCRTDVTRFYESIRIDILEQMLYERECDRASVERIIGVLRFWRELHGRDGLPIGPEGCAVLGSFYLEPVDRSIISTGITHRRYGDDFLFFTENQRFSKALVDLFGEELSKLYLERSEEKTFYFDDPKNAKANLKDSEIDYLDGPFSYSPGLKGNAVRRALVACNSEFVREIVGKRHGQKGFDELSTTESAVTGH